MTTPSVSPESRTRISILNRRRFESRLSVFAVHYAIFCRRLLALLDLMPINTIAALSFHIAHVVDLNHISARFSRIVLDQWACQSDTLVGIARPHLQKAPRQADAARL